MYKINGLNYLEYAGGSEPSHGEGANLKFADFRPFFKPTTLNKVAEILNYIIYIE